MKETKLQLEAYILSILLLERLDEINDNSKQGMKHYTGKLIQEIEASSKDLSKTTTDVASVLSQGLENMLNSLIKEVAKTNL
tara:strand:+ start:735 stop:980 length:246 start_codon:yes stop_codon:yes gene_type:complete